MGRPQFETVVAQAQRKYMAFENITQGISVAAGATYEREFFSPTKTIARVKSLMFNFNAVSGASSGTHEATIYIGSQAHAPRIELIKGVAAYNSAVTFWFNEWLSGITATPVSGKYDLQDMLGYTDEIPFSIFYRNNTNATSNPTLLFRMYSEIEEDALMPTTIERNGKTLEIRDGFDLSKYISAGWKVEKQTPSKTVVSSSAKATTTTTTKTTAKPKEVSILSSAYKQTPQQQRAAEYANFTGWSNDPQIRKWQEESLSIYIDTGKWDTKKQKELHQLAEDRRKLLNPAYEGTTTGPENKSQEDMIILPIGQFVNSSKVEGAAGAVVDNFSQVLQIGGLLIAGIVVLNLFK